MVKATIFTEGKEKLFIQAVLKSIGLQETPDFQNVRGWTKIYGSATKNILEQNTRQRKQNLIIFDADYPQNGGGFAKRKEQIQANLKDLSYALFLFPNNRDNGDYELLLETIINPEHQALMQCFEGYEKCLAELQNDYVSPNRKSKMYAYINAFQKSLTEQEALKNKHDWHFENPEYWNLEASELKPLKTFLTKYL